MLINPKSYRLVRDVCVKNICVWRTVFADAFKRTSFTAVSAVLSQII